MTPNGNIKIFKLKIMTKQEIEKQISDLNAEIERLRQTRPIENAPIIPFEEIDWKSIYETILEEYIEPRLSGDTDEDDSQYLYEYLLQIVCPTIFR
jgi:hypothetical protein